MRPGDTLLRIAMRQGLTVQRLAMANGMHITSWVYIGQRLKIPAQATSSPAPAPPQTTEPAQAVEPAPSPAPAQDTTSAPAAPAASATYAVRPGDSLIGIAARHGIGVSQLAAANGLRMTSWVYVGQRLRIPGPGAAQAPLSDAPQPASPTANPQPAPPSAVGTKWIDVDLTAQTLTAYAGDQALLHTKVSTGTRFTPTVVGTYRVYSKYASTHMSGPGYSVPNVPNVMFFLRRVQPPRHVLAQQFRHAHEPRLRQPAPGRGQVALRLGAGGDKGGDALLGPPQSPAYERWERGKGAAMRPRRRRQAQAEGRAPAKVKRERSHFLCVFARPTGGYRGCDLR